MIPLGFIIKYYKTTMRSLHISNSVDKKKSRGGEDITDGGDTEKKKDDKRKVKHR